MVVETKTETLAFETETLDIASRRDRDETRAYDPPLIARGNSPPWGMGRGLAHSPAGVWGLYPQEFVVVKSAVKYMHFYSLS